MATKKTSTKKTPAKKPSTARKSTAKKSTKKPVASRMSLRNHVGLQREELAFFTFRITKQTVYWLVLGAVVIMFTLWLAKLQSDIQDLYDQVDASTALMSTP